MTFDRVLATFDPFLTLFEPFSTVIDPIWDRFLDHFWTKIGPFWGDSGVILDHFLVDSVTLGSLRDRFSIVLASIWARFCVVLTPF